MNIDRRRSATVASIGRWKAEQLGSVATMNETRKVPKNLFDLAKALGRWESEGGSTELQGSELGQEITPQAAEERILRCLGAAVILQWNDLPTDIQRIIFEDAASMSDPERRFRLKQQMARFLHNHKDDAE
jgi:Fe-S cluster biosynthesis and repair protein YggX